jgi:hypothetical protein
MFKGFEKLVEERIRVAQRRGDMDNLEGRGKPLVFEDDSHIPEDLRLPYKILKNADCLPPEIELRKEIQKTEDLLAAMQDTAEKYRTIKKLNFMIMKLNSMRNTNVDFEVPQRYHESLVNRLESKSVSGEKGR